MGAASAIDEAALCRELVPRVRAWAFRRTRDLALAADIAQEVSVIVVESLRAGRIEDPSRIAAFALGAAKNVLVAQQRGERRRAALLDRFGPSLADVATIEEHKVDREKVVACFAKLAPRAQTVLLLTFHAERSAEEIASELGVAAGNVRVLRHRALAQLHACMGGTA